MKKPLLFQFMRNENFGRKNQTDTDTFTQEEKKPPVISKNIFTDIKYFFIQKPSVDTLITFQSEVERQQFCDSILQRLNIGVENYKMLNIHKIGIDVPPSYLFEELLKWNGKCIYWPNHLAKVNLHDNKLDKIQIYLFGRSTDSYKFKKNLFTMRLFHLFDLKAINIKSVPDIGDTDNARYLLFKCHGGYPIGVFSMYVRSSIPENGEKEISQLFIIVGFNFYGKKYISNIGPICKVWETIHNRVTRNVANRCKQLTEWQFENFSKGI